MEYKTTKERGVPKYYYTDLSPRHFFGELSTERKPGMFFVSGVEQTGKWHAHYAFPTQLSVDIANSYPLGSGIDHFKLIKWPNGRELTVICKRSDLAGFYPEVWAGLTPKPEDQD